MHKLLRVRNKELTIILNVPQYKGYKGSSCRLIFNKVENMKVKIYKPAKNAMQSGRAKTQGWVLEYESISTRKPESLMGWTQSGDTLNQVRLKFDSADDAARYAEKKGWEYMIMPVQERKVKPRNYGDNFKYVQPEE